MRLCPIPGFLLNPGGDEIGGDVDSESGPMGVLLAIEVLVGMLFPSADEGGREVDYIDSVLLQYFEELRV